MTSALWQATPCGYEWNGYRIVALGPGGRYRWRLERRSTRPGGPAWSTISFHRRLRTAEYHAAAADRARTRHRRVTWRAVAGGAAMAAAVALMPAMTVATFVAMIVCLTLGVRLVIEAVALWFAPDNETLAGSWPRTERLALRIMASLERPAPAELDDVATQRVRVLPAGPAGPQPCREGPDDEPGYQLASPMHIC